MNMVARDEGDAEVNAAGDARPTGFEPYSGDVYAWAFRLLGRHHDALDVVQDVFMRWSDQCFLAPPTNTRGWLRRVTVNRAIDLHRGRTAEKVAREQNATCEATVPDRTIEALDLSSLRGDVATALDDLSEMQRSVLVAKVYDELTFSEIADELRVSVSTAKTHYLRALRAVRDRLAPRWARELKP
jgi:RNA polymerase sigma-70 factor (ECF subfamily)